jgi:membrane protein
VGKVGDQPEGPGELGRRGWSDVLRGTVRRFRTDDLADRAAALTFYGVLSLFPMLLVVASLIGLSGAAGTKVLSDNIRRIAPGPIRDALAGAVESLRGTASTAGPLAAVSVVAALWSASRYIAAFVRVTNAIYETREERPFWKMVFIRLALTVLVVIVLSAATLAAVFTSRLTSLLGRMFGIGSAVIMGWNLFKWPALALTIVLVITTLYRVAPAVRQPGLRWVTPGGVLAVLVWAVASAGFQLYVAHFGSFNRIYGSLAGVVIFMVWLWLSNVALLLGAELDAELVRARQRVARESGGRT